MKYNLKSKSIRLGSYLPYEVRNESGDWSKYFGQWEGQKHDDLDSNCCWAYAGNEVLEDQLEFLMKEGYFMSEDIKWFKDNGYIDEDGDFYLSRRFIPILSGVKRNGNDHNEFWRITKIYGAIPSKLLPFTNNNEYFDKSKITPAMYALGKEFLKRVDITYQELGKRWVPNKDQYGNDIRGWQIMMALKQGELQIGVPVPRDVSQWNKEKVNWDGQYAAHHSIALYKYDNTSDYPYYIYDQYNPILKRLSKDYYIPMIVQAIIYPKMSAKPNVVNQLAFWPSIYKAVMEWLQKTIY